MKKEKGISKTEDGFLIRIYRSGRTISGHVAFGSYSSEEEAFEAAIRIRDEFERSYPKEVRPGRQPSIGHTYDRTTSGKLYCWQVVYYKLDPSGKQIRKSKRFYDHKYGSSEKAEEAAIRFYNWKKENPHLV